MSEMAGPLCDAQGEDCLTLWSPRPSHRPGPALPTDPKGKGALEQWDHTHTTDWCNVLVREVLPHSWQLMATGGADWNPPIRNALEVKATGAYLLQRASGHARAFLPGPPAIFANARRNRHGASAEERSCLCTAIVPTLHPTALAPEPGAGTCRTCCLNQERLGASMAAMTPPFRHAALLQQLLPRRAQVPRLLACRKEVCSHVRRETSLVNPASIDTPLLNCRPTAASNELRQGVGILFPCTGHVRNHAGLQHFVCQAKKREHPVSVHVHVFFEGRQKTSVVAPGVLSYVD